MGVGIAGLSCAYELVRGHQVTVLEALPTFLGAVDEQIAKEAKKAFDKNSEDIVRLLEIHQHLGGSGVGRRSSCSMRWPPQAPQNKEGG